ncbi:MAG: lipopolysaccharide heptosyltransferase II, partial [Candidatus Hydrogenedentota bacterium]
KEETLTLNPRKKVLNLNLPCSPCGKKMCPRKDKPLECLEGIEPDEVLLAMKQLEKKV